MFFRFAKLENGKRNGREKKVNIKINEIHLIGQHFG